MGKLDQAAIDRVRGEAWPQVQNPDELHDALVELGFITEAEGLLGEFAVDEATSQRSISIESETDGPPEWTEFLKALSGDRRAAVLVAGIPKVPPAAARRSLADNGEIESPERQSLSAMEGGKAAQTLSATTLPATTLPATSRFLGQGFGLPRNGCRICRRSSPMHSCSP